MTFENNEVIRYRGRVLPLVRLGRLFGMAASGERGRFHVLVVGSRRRAASAWPWTGVAGLREIVVRPLADPLVAVPRRSPARPSWATGASA